MRSTLPDAVAIMTLNHAINLDLTYMDRINLTIRDITFTNASKTALLVETLQHSILRLVRCAFVGNGWASSVNTTYPLGAGLHVGSSILSNAEPRGYDGQLFIVDCEFSRNRAWWGAGMLFTISSTNLTIQNTTFIDNVALWSGAGIFTQYSSGFITITGSTFERNVAGGGVLPATDLARLTLASVGVGGGGKCPLGSSCSSVALCSGKEHTLSCVCWRSNLPAQFPEQLSISLRLDLSIGINSAPDSFGCCHLWVFFWLCLLQCYCSLCCCDWSRSKVGICYIQRWLRTGARIGVRGPGSHLHINDTVFSCNIAERYGGGLWTATGVRVEVYLLKTRFFNNTAVAVASSRSLLSYFEIDDTGVHNNAVGGGWFSSGMAGVTPSPCTAAAPYQHCNSTVPTLQQHRTNTAAAPYQHCNSTVPTL